MADSDQSFAVTAKLVLQPRLIYLLLFLLLVADDGVGAPWKVIDDGCGDNHGEMWNQALGRVQFASPEPRPPSPDSYHQVKILEAGRLSEVRFDSLKHWVKNGGTLLVSGAPPQTRFARTEIRYLPSACLHLPGCAPEGTILACQMHFQPFATTRQY